MIFAVTGYVPIPDHPRSMEEYRFLIAQLLDCGIPIVKVEGALEECWLYQYLRNRGGKFTHSVADNPRKNSVAYHCVQAQKSEWLAQAYKYVPALMYSDVLVWIDAGIFSVPGINAKVIRDFMIRAQTERTIAVPGCWNRDYEYDDTQPCWRFCGGVMIVPQMYTSTFDAVMKGEYRRWLKLTGNLSWEVNTLARVEQRHPELPIWHYKADHNATLFTAYRAGEDADGKQAQTDLRRQQARYC